MSKLTELAALRMREREILAIECARCAHSLACHSLTGARKCHGDWKDAKRCGCVDWAETLDEQQALKV